jgi:hypothetical protein
METFAPNPTKIATKWAVISALTSILITYAFQLLNVEQDSPVKYVSLIPFVIFLMLAQKEFKDANNNYITFGEGFSTGFRYAIFSGLIMAVFIYIYLAFLNPGLLERAMDLQREKMHEQGLSDGDIDKAIGFGKKLGPVFGAFGTAIFDAILGVVFGLIGAAIFKKERSPFDDDVAVHQAV